MVNNNKKGVLQTKPEHQSFRYCIKTIILTSGCHENLLLVRTTKPFQRERQSLLTKEGKYWLPEPLRVQSDNLSIRHGEMHLSAGRPPSAQLSFIV